MKKILCSLLLLCTLLWSTACGIGKPPQVTLHKPEDPGYISPLFPDETSKDETKVPSDSPEPPPTPTSPTPTPSKKPLPPIPDPNFLTEQYFLYDVSRKAFIKIKNKNEVVYPASITKLLTILYAKTILPLNQVVSAGNELELVGEGSSIAYIKKGHRLTVKQLIEGMLLPSGNDAAYVLAAAGGKALNPKIKDGKQAVYTFVDGMNIYAKKIGLISSHFVNPDGYESKEQYTSVEDMAVLARLASEDDTIQLYAKLPKDDVTYISGEINTWVNSNKCLHKDSPFYSPHVTGLKTGTISKEYSCFLATVEIDGQSFICGFFAEKNPDHRFTDALTAVEYLKKYVIV